MNEAGIGFDRLDGVAAAAGPGLIGGVIVGLTTAKAIALVLDKPLIAVNHLEAHALTPRLVAPLAFPYCLFLVSGGHTQIVAVLGVGQYVRLGTTIDDAIGEAFDKIAKLLGLPYPGGPEVERAALRGNPARFAFPRPMMGRPEPNFSLSGLKTAVRMEAERIAPLSEQDVADLCASFQAAVIESTADRLKTGLQQFREQFGAPTALVAAGGVAANQTHADRHCANAAADVPTRNLVAAAARALHRQRRDDRLGRRGAARARLHRSDGRRAARALAARRESTTPAPSRQHARGLSDEAACTMPRNENHLHRSARAPGAPRSPTRRRAPDRDVILWTRNAGRRRAWRKPRSNPRLPGIALDEGAVLITGDLAHAARCPMRSCSACRRRHAREVTGARAACRMARHAGGRLRQGHRARHAQIHDRDHRRDRAARGAGDPLRPVLRQRCRARPADRGHARRAR